ncbi:MAG: hypothetical protein NT129_00485 [Candidatus Aenigmarchaeota archaeon]|nr:hypothetical protein [Candidatus Aenigmarchaeota archaeon]
MKLNEIAEQLYVALVGNRLTLLSEIAIFSGFYGLVKDDSLVWGIPVWAGSMLFLYTAGGLSTVDYFNRTEKHIKRFGRLDERFSKALIDGTENNGAGGYCPIQGMYLAAKKYGQLDVFHKAKKDVSNNIIPNF